MRSAPCDQIGRSLNACGAVQTTAAGIAIAVGCVLRDAIIVQSARDCSMANAYIPVFALAVFLPACATFVAKPLLVRRLKMAKDPTHPKLNQMKGR